MHLIRTLAAGTLLLLSACSSPPKVEEPKGSLNRFRAGIHELQPKIWKEPYSSPALIPVLFATNRENGGIRPSTEMRFGIASVKVPSEREIGSIEGGYEIQDTRPVSIQDLKALLSQEAEWGTLVFIHGFNVDFNQALQRAAQLAFDLKFQGKILLLSWPAGTDGGLLEKSMIHRTYEQNRRNAKASIPPVANLLVELSTLPTPVQVLVHSMGHQILIPALQIAAGNLQKPFIQELILNAPDLDPADFEAALPALKKLTDRITLYCSQNDNALLASQAINRNRRLGSCRTQPGVDVINVSDLDDPGILGLGHGYYSSRPVLTDVYQTLLGMDAERRLFIKNAPSDAPSTYILRK